MIARWTKRKRAIGIRQLASEGFRSKETCIRGRGSMKGSKEVHTWIIMALACTATLVGGWAFGRAIVSDDSTPRFGLFIHVDPLTKCHYLSTQAGDLRPRLNCDGLPMCGRVDEEGCPDEPTDADEE